MLQKPETPTLPNAGPTYTQGFQDQFSRVLRLYFNQLANAVNNLIGRFGGRHLEFPHGAFHDETSQYAAAALTPYPVRVSTTSLGAGVTVQSASRITVEYSGVYSIQYSLQLSNPDTQLHLVGVWLSKNGTNVAATETLYSVPSSQGGAPGRLGAAINYLVKLDAGDYLELIWAPDNTQVFIEYRAPQVAPERPSIPSAIITMQFVSALP